MRQNLYIRRSTHKWGCYKYVNTFNDSGYTELRDNHAERGLMNLLIRVIWTSVQCKCDWIPRNITNTFHWFPHKSVKSAPPLYTFFWLGGIRVTKSWISCDLWQNTHLTIRGMPSFVRILPRGSPATPWFVISWMSVQSEIVCAWIPRNRLFVGNEELLSSSIVAAHNCVVEATSAHLGEDLWFQGRIHNKQVHVARVLWQIWLSKMNTCFQLVYLDINTVLHVTPNQLTWWETHKCVQIEWTRYLN